MIEEKIARICWNTNLWQKPSGPIGKSRNKKAYEYITGYGHEEWLLDTEKIIDGYHYSYLQAIGAHRDKYIGEKFHISLYSINNDTKERWWIFAGNIIIDTENIEKVGKNNSIAVPDMFYKVVIMDGADGQPPHVLAFLFPHFKNKADVKDGSIFHYLVSIDYLEAITGLDFFNTYSNGDQKKIESKVDVTAWSGYID